MSANSNWSNYHQRTYTSAGNGVYICHETSDQPLPPLPETAPVEQVKPVERSSEARAAALHHALITRVERAQRAQEAVRQQQQRRAERVAYALEQAERRALPPSQPAWRLPWE